MLYLTNQFLEFYHNPTNVKQGLHYIMNQLAIFDNVHTHLLIQILKTQEAV